MTDTAHSGRLWLIRHGETEWSRTGRHTGMTDIPLTEAGRAAASAVQAELAEALRGRSVGMVRVSPLARAQDTARLAGLTADVVDPDLHEWDYGAWEGRTTAEIRDSLGDPGWLVWDHPIPPGTGPGATPGEQLDEVALRVDRVITACQPYLAQGQDCILVAHGHVLRILTARWLGLEPIAGRLFALDPARLSALGFEHEQHVIQQWNSL